MHHCICSVVDVECDECFLSRTSKSIASRVPLVKTVENDDQQTTIEFQHLVETKRSRKLQRVYRISSPAMGTRETHRHTSDSDQLRSRLHAMTLNDERIQYIMAWRLELMLKSREQPKR
jgi:hypothetical protein